MVRGVTKELLLSGAINRVAVLSKALSGEIKVYTTQEILENVL